MILVRGASGRGTLGSRGARSGFALILALLFMTLLLTLLVAAHGSVLTSMRQIARSGDRMEEAELTARLLAVAEGDLKAGRQSDEGSPALGGGSRSLTASMTFRSLAEGDDLYASLPGIDHRGGDALVVIVFQRGDPSTESHQYLLNGSGRRTGAIEIE